MMFFFQIDQYQLNIFHNNFGMDDQMRTYLNQPGIDLGEFVLENNDIFPTATTYPEFFNQNLLSSYRVIKHFQDNPHSNIRVFYYHLLKLSYEILNEEGQLTTRPLQNFKTKVFDTDFQIRFTEQTQEQRMLYNNFQFKRLLAQFLTVLDSQEEPNFQKIINTYPIIDIVLIHVLRSLLCTVGVEQQFNTKIDTELVFGSLCNMLQMGLNNYSNCWKFQDSDMFCLDETGEDLYFVFCLQQSEHNSIKDLQQKSGSGIRNDEMYSTLQNKSFVQQPQTFGQAFGEFERNAQDKQNVFRQNFFKQNTYSKFGPVISTSQNTSVFSRASSDIKNDLLKLQLSAGKLLSNSGIKSDIHPNHGKLLNEMSSISHTISHNNSLRVSDLEHKKSSFALHALPNRELYQISQNKEEYANPYQANYSTEKYLYQPCNLSQKEDAFDHIYQPQKSPFESLYLPEYNSTYEPKYQPSYQQPSYQQPSYQPSFQPLHQPIFEPVSNYRPPVQVPSYKYEYSNYQTKSYPVPSYDPNKSITLGDYYRDFTNSFLLPLIKEPYQSSVRGIKGRMKSMRRENIMKTPF